MGQKSRRQGAKGSSGGAHALKSSHALSPLRTLDNDIGVNINKNDNITPSAAFFSKVRVINVSKHLN
jgi:hypothetical protein